uniref:Maltogenic Amylase C-terminal domain-containing protein n=1 Tax=Megaselia scalaris TaxID=36166 RepID=T1GKZ4_MEGSC
TINVESERKVADSHLNLYKELHNLRQKSTFINGEAQVKALNQNVLAIRRSLKGDYTYITLVNIWDEFEFIDLSVAFPETTSSEFEYVFVNRRSQHSKKDKTKPYSITLMPKEAVVLKSKKIE